MTADPSVLSVTEITERIKKLIRENFKWVSVRGELADLTHYEASGHLYFSLSDGDARLGGVMFAYANRRLSFEPEEGMEVIVRGRLDVYEPRGDYQVIVEEMEPAGRGTLEREFEQLKQTLREEGALEPAHKQNLPDFPLKIGVVTSGDGAAFWDIVRTLRRRCPAVQVILYPSRVNGREAAGDIAGGVRRLPEVVDVDCMIVGRGGGSPEDLWGFNEEKVARAILDASVPVVSAVGHEVDVTIADLVADHRSATPTAAAEEVAPSLEEMKSKLNELTNNLRVSFRNRLDRGWEKIRFMAEKQVLAEPQGLLEPFRERLSRWRERLTNNYSIFVTEKQHSLSRFSDRLDSMNPRRVLERGYALVSRSGEPVTSSSAVDPGDKLQVRWQDGEREVTVDDE